MVSRLLIIGSVVATSGDSEPAADAVVVENGLITAIGQREDLERGHFDEVLGSSAHFLLPGLINTHHHSEGHLTPYEMTHLFERHSLAWHATFAMQMSEEDFYYTILAGLISCVRGGQTGVLDMFYGNPNLPRFGMDAALQAYQDLGLRGTLAMSLRDQNRYAHEPDEKFFARMSDELASELRASTLGYAWNTASIEKSIRGAAAEWHDPSGLTRVGVAPDWTPACSDDLFIRAAALASELDTTMTTHVLESPYELTANLNAHGSSAMRRLERLGVLSPRFVSSHFVWATDEDLQITAETGCIVSHNPGSNIRLGSGLARTADMRALGIPVGIGTDGLSLTGDEDLLSDIRLAAYLSREPRLTGHTISVSEMLVGSVTAGTHALGRTADTGLIRIGEAANLLVMRKPEWALNAPERTPTSLEALLENAGRRDLEASVIDGKPVLTGGSIRTVNESAVSQRNSELMSRRREMLQRGGSAHREFIELPEEVARYAQEAYDEDGLATIMPASARNARGAFVELRPTS